MHTTTRSQIKARGLLRAARKHHAEALLPAEQPDHRRWGAAQLLEGVCANTTLTLLNLDGIPMSDAAKQAVLLVKQNRGNPAAAQARAEAAAAAVAVPPAEAPLAGGAAAAGAAGSTT